MFSSDYGKISFGDQVVPLEREKEERKGSTILFVFCLIIISSDTEKSLSNSPGIFLPLEDLD